METFFGKQGFIWWQGVVEDIEDPLKLGRCRVRIFGFHVPDKGIRAAMDINPRIKVKSKPKTYRGRTRCNRSPVLHCVA